MVRNEVEDIEDRFGKKKRKSKRKKRRGKRKILWADDVHKENWDDDDDNDHDHDDDHDHDHDHAGNSHKWHDHDDDHHGHTSHASWRDRPWRLSAQPAYRPTYQTHHHYYVSYPDRQPSYQSGSHYEPETYYEPPRRRYERRGWQPVNF